AALMVGDDRRADGGAATLGCAAGGLFVSVRRQGLEPRTR
ncbi:hydrolase, partial [Streptomyces albidoflavus]